MRKAYIISLDNGLSYDSERIENIAVCLSKITAKRFIKDNSPVTNELYVKTFGYEPVRFVFDVRLHIQEVDLMDAE